MRKWDRLLWLGLALLWTLGAGCSRRADSPPAPPEAAVPGTIAADRQAGGEWMVGVTLLTRAHAFYNDLEEGMQEEADRQGIKLSINSAEWDLVKQTDQVRDFITQGVDALVICPVNSQGIGTAVKEANDAGIPVFTADIASEGSGEVVCHIASDNHLGGRLAGLYMGRLLQGKGKVLVIDQPTVTSVIQRVAGFEQAIAEFPGIEIVDKPRAEKGLRPVAKSVTEDYLQRYADLSGIFGSNDDCALGALQAVRAAGRDDIVIVGFDATDEARSEILKGGPLKADAVQFPRKIGTRTIEIIADFLASGERPPASVPIEVALVDRASLESGTYLEEADLTDTASGDGSAP